MPGIAKPNYIENLLLRIRLKEKTIIIITTAEKIFSSAQTIGCINCEPAVFSSRKIWEQNNEKGWMQVIFFFFLKKGKRKLEMLSN